MRKEGFRHIFPFLLFLADVLIIFCAFFLAYWVRFYSPLTGILPVTKGIPPLSFYFYGSIFVALVWVAVFNAYGLYKRTRPRGASTPAWRRRARPSFSQARPSAPRA